MNTVKEWDYYPTTGSPSTTPTRETDYTYVGNDVQQVTVLDSNGIQAGQTTYGYTTNATATSGVVGHGGTNSGGPYLQTVAHWLSTGSSPTTTYTSDDTGTVLSTVDPKSNPSTTFTYQCANSLPYQASNALGQTTTYGYDCNSGALTSVKDPNDLAASRAGTTYTYEAVAGRPSTVSFPDGGLTTYSYPSSTQIDTAVTATPDPTITSSDILDSYGRPYQHLRAGVSSETSYDSSGRVSCTTNPHLTGSSSSTDGSTCITTYDGLNRPLVQTQPDSATLNWSYSGNVTISSDEAGNSWQRTSNAFGQLVKVVEPGNLPTTYAYDGLGNPSTITQNGVSGETPRIRRFSYDSLSRLAKICNPESIPAIATCDGVNNWSNTYTYDPNGNLSTKTDARGITTNYSYDALNRLKLKSYTNGTMSAQYDYDQNGSWNGIPRTNTIGRLWHVAVGAHTSQWNERIYSYDPIGRTQELMEANPSEVGTTNHLTTFGYDLVGNLTSLTYPDGRLVKQTWDSAARLQAVTFDSWNGQHVGYQYLNSASYWPTGSPASMTFGNGDTETYTLNNRLQPVEIALKGGASNSNQKYFDKQYCYGPSASTPACPSLGSGKNNGNIWQITDALNANHTQGFSYDNLNRLYAFSNGDASMQQSYVIDSFGNMNVNGGTLQSNLSFGVNNQINSSGYVSDQAGNITTVNVGAGIYQNFVYDAESRITDVNSGAATYVYDAEGSRVRKNVGSNWTEYVYFNGQPLAEKNSDGTWSDYIFANGRRIARADTFDNRIHLHGTMTATNNYAGWNLPFSGYTVRNGDKLSWRQAQFGGARGGIGIRFSDNTYSNWTTYDTDGQVMNDDTTQGAWHNRTVDLSLFAGKTVSALWINADARTPAGTWDSFFNDIAMNNSTDGTVLAIDDDLAAIGLSYFGLSGAVNVSGTVDPLTTVNTPSWAPGNVVFYHGDQIGSVQAVTGAEGWPLSSFMFYPFGREPATPADANHYKFTGLEHDAESGLDHATFRQYASTAGRWMSPDPYNGSMDINYPQTFNRYAYVGNNPLGYTDPTGLNTQCSTSTVYDTSGNVISSTTPQNCITKDDGEWWDPVDWPKEIFSLFTGRPKFKGSLKPRPNNPTPNPVKIHGNWCGPDWTGGTAGQYSPTVDASGGYKPPIDSLDGNCMQHDKCYAACRQKATCDAAARGSCFAKCDLGLASATNSEISVAGASINILMTFRSADTWLFRPDP